MTRVLIAGATGYLGGYVTSCCRRRGFWVRALARSPDRLSDVDGPIDDIVVGEATDPSSIEGVCEGIDVVFTSLGITRQNDKVGYWDVDYGANRTLLDQALASGVRRFVFVSVLHGEQLRHVELVAAREKLVDELKQADIEYAVIRPSGFFADAIEVLEMARRGRVYVVGDGHYRSNPIHGEDLAQVCADAMIGGDAVIEVGGPQVLTQREAAEQAFAALGKPPRTTGLPPWLLTAAVAGVRPFSRRLHGIGSFMSAVLRRDMVAPRIGQHTLSDFFREQAAAESGLQVAADRA